VITCNRCGKENQDHYKFCLGCGNEIKAQPAPGAIGIAPATGEGPLTFSTAQAVAPTVAPFSPPSLFGAGRAPTPAATGGALPGMSPAAPAAAPTPHKSGIPWNDSPRMPASREPARASAALAAAAVPGLSAPAVARAPAAIAAPPPAAAQSISTISCPSCGKDVKVGFAFCGVCGTRVAAPAAAGGPSGIAASSAAGPPGIDAAALGAQRTMFMAAPVPSAVPAPRGRLILIRPDGTEGGAHPLHDGENLIGRGQGGLFDSDAYLSPRHAELILAGNGLAVRDLRSLNGVFVKLAAEESLQSGDIFRIGQELLRFDVIQPPAPLEDGTEVMGTPNPGFWGRLSVVVGRDVDGSAFPIFGDAIVLGRERGDVVFPEDGYVSGTHARISLRDGHVYLADLGSSNGTFFRIRGERPITSGAFLLMGQQLFRVEYR